MIIEIVLLVIGSKLTFTQNVHNVVLTGEEYKIENPNYPEMAPENFEISWNFSVEPKQKIIFKCFDLSTTRPTEWDPCGTRSVMILNEGNGEETLCGRYLSYSKLTQGSHLTVRFQSGPTASGRYSCHVRANVKTKVETKDIQLGDHSVNVYIAEDKFAEVTRNLITEPGCGIKLICDVMDTYETNPCSTDKIIIEDDANVREYCGSGTVFIDTDSSKLTIRLFTDERSGYIRCVAAKIKHVANENIHLELGQPAYDSIIKKSDPYFNKTWTFTTSPGSRIAVTCLDLRYPQFQKCQDDFYAVDDGNGEQIGCNTNSGKAFFSIGEKLTFRVQSGPHGSGILHCMAQAVDGPTPDHYMNIISKEVDSSEYGQENGLRNTNCRCGWSNKGANSGARIFHGTQSKQNEFPWMVAIRDSSKFYFCGGSIISQWHVLTATHCLHEIDTETVYVVIGEHDISKDDADKDTAKAIRVAKRYFANGYSNVTFTNDIAVLLLEEKIEFNNNIGPICLTPNRLNLDNKYILAMGWGTTHNSRNSPILMKGYVRVVDINVCNAKYGWALKNNDDYHKVCYYSKTSDTCSGDSGGPLVWLDPETNRYTQISLVSFAHACGYHTPSVSTEVAYFYNWIQSIIADTHPEETICRKI